MSGETTICEGYVRAISIKVWGVQYDTTTVRKDAMYTVNKLCHTLRHELCPMEVLESS